VRGVTVMDNLEMVNSPESPIKVNKHRNKALIILATLLIISILGNGFLAVTWWKYNKAYNTLQTNYSNKSNTLSLTEHQMTQVKKEKLELETSFNEALKLLAEYDREYKKLALQDVTSRIPKNYYTGLSSQGNGSYEGLKEFLNYKFYLPNDYTLNVFDCSESAAYLEYVLQNNGFDAKIAVGKDPAGSGVGHAWVIVNTSEGLAVIEPTVLTGGVQRILDSISNIMNNSARGMVYYDKNNQVSKNYYEAYDAVFEDIFEAVKYSKSIEEWNWWEGSWGFE
jgi:hypothetical protein